jgi:crotonobetainyl-CoA:carnitine CoA-transferase CaiB-like acyl-CoA transferase
MEMLQAAGIRAGIVNTMKDVYTDPQLAQRPQWIELEHPEIGKMHYQRPPFLLSKTPPGPSKRDPLLAEHNDYFYKELLGMSDDEYQNLVEEQVIY